jgi:hypothetical protein
MSSAILTYRYPLCMKRAEVSVLKQRYYVRFDLFTYLRNTLFLPRLSKLYRDVVLLISSLTRLLKSMTRVN